MYHVRNHQRHCNPCVASRQADILGHTRKSQCKALTSHRACVVHFHAAELNVCGIAIKRLIRGRHQLAVSQFLHNGPRGCRQLSGRLEEILVSGELCVNDFSLVGPSNLGDGKVYSEVERRFLLHLATNSATFDQANS